MIEIDFSISNIAWPRQETDNVLGHLKNLGYNSIEVAPTRIWERPLEVSRQDRSDYLKYINNRGFKIVSIHSLFFGLEDMNIFGSPEEVHNITIYLEGLIKLSCDLNIPIMIFGSPPQRDIKNLDYDMAFEKACEFFYAISKVAEIYSVKLLIEPLARYESSFINTLSEGFKLVCAVNRDGFGLHMDAKSIADENAENKSFDEIFEKYVAVSDHFHVNENDLGILSENTIYHSIFGKLLKKYNYSKCVSIEMKTFSDYYSSIEQSTFILRKYYNMV